MYKCFVYLSPTPENFVFHPPPSKIYKMNGVYYLLYLNPDQFIPASKKNEKAAPSLFTLFIFSVF